MNPKDRDLKRLTQRLVAVALVLGAVTAVTPAALADFDPIGGGGTEECPRPEVGWEVNANPPSVYVYANPGKICLAS